MAPRKSKTTGEDKGKAVAVTSTMQTRSMDRQTRSQTQRRGGNSLASSSSKFMKLKSSEKKKRKKKATEGGAANKKIKKEEEAKEVEEEESAEEDDAAAEEEEDDSKEKKIVIEHCKQCKSFRERAKEVKDGLEKAIPGIVVTVNADKPRRGCFEIREEGGATFISLLGMKRPFKKMKDLDMEQVVANIVRGLNNRLQIGSMNAESLVSSSTLGRIK